MDWGLIRSFDRNKNYLLRNKIMYPQWFYYYAIVMNFFLRYFFLISIIANGNGSWSWDKLKLWTAISALAEAYRRAQWSLIRVENEN
jgi:hypothetical protein